MRQSPDFVDPAAAAAWWLRRSLFFVANRTLLVYRSVVHLLVLSDIAKSGRFVRGGQTATERAPQYRSGRYPLTRGASYCTPVIESGPFGILLLMDRRGGSSVRFALA